MENASSGHLWMLEHIIITSYTLSTIPFLPMNESPSLHCNPSEDKNPLNPIFSFKSLQHRFYNQHTYIRTCTEHGYYLSYLMCANDNDSPPSIRHSISGSSVLMTGNSPISLTSRFAGKGNNKCSLSSMGEP